MKLAAIALASLLVAPVLAQAPPPKIELAYTQFTLPNGLHVILHEDHSVPIVTTNVWYHVGSARERTGRTGFAHLFEHLMFMGSAHAKYGQFDEWLESAGGENNASTENDRTNYYINVPNALELALFLESTMGTLIDAMTPKTVDAQRRGQERAPPSYENRPCGMAEITIGEMLYPEERPYHWPVIGYMPDLTAASYDDVVAFFKTYYAPSNASLVAGDFETATARRLVEKWFGEEAGRRRAHHDSRRRADGRAKKTITDRVQLPRLFLAWLTPPTSSPATRLDVVADILASGKNSRLYLNGWYELQIAQDVSAYSSRRTCPRRSASSDAAPGSYCRRDPKVVRRSQNNASRRMKDAAAVESAKLCRPVEYLGDSAGQRINSLALVNGRPLVPQDLARYRASPRPIPRRDWCISAARSPHRGHRAAREVNHEIHDCVSLEQASHLAIVALAACSVALMAQAPDRAQPPALGPAPAPAAGDRKAAAVERRAGLIVELHEVPSRR
jgi:zinc protease